MSILDVISISTGYGKASVLRDISFSVEPGSVMGVLGANGSGKTTLIKSICGLLPHKGICRTGDIELESLTSRQIAKLVSYIPQRSGVSIDISVLDAVLMGFNPHLGILENPAKSMKDEALRVLTEVGLSGFENKSYLTLSEGEKQLCILARTMVSGSRILFLDEPESALDFNHRYRMLKKLRLWVNVSNGTALVALHDPILALNYCDKLLVLKDGKTLDVFSPKESRLEDMENTLSQIYGPVCLQWCKNHSGKEFLMMIREDDV